MHNSAPVQASCACVRQGVCLVDGRNAGGAHTAQSPMPPTGEAEGEVLMMCVCVRRRAAQKATGAVALALLSLLAGAYASSL